MKQLKLRNPHLIGIQRMTGIETMPEFQKALQRLRALEQTAHKNAEKYANGEIGEGLYEGKKSRMMLEIKSILKNSVHVFINNDPRGYAIKTDQNEAEEFGIEQDWGKYGIIAPEGLYIYKSHAKMFGGVSE